MPQDATPSATLWPTGLTPTRPFGRKGVAPTPRPSPTGSGPGGSGSDEVARTLAPPPVDPDLLRLFIGPKADKFMTADGKARTPLSLFVLAFFLGFNWFLYRKAWGLAILLFTALLIIQQLAPVAAWILHVAVAVTAGRLYLWHARRKVRGILRRNLSEVETEAAVAKAGGGSWRAVVLGYLAIMGLSLVYGAVVFFIIMRQQGL